MPDSGYRKIILLLLSVSFKLAYLWVNSLAGLQKFVQGIPFTDRAEGLARGKPLIYAFHVESMPTGQHPELIALPAANPQKMGSSLIHQYKASRSA